MQRERMIGKGLFSRLKVSKKIWLISLFSVLALLVVSIFLYTELSTQRSLLKEIYTARSQLTETKTDEATGSVGSDASHLAKLYDRSSQAYHRAVVSTAIILTIVILLIILLCIAVKDSILIPIKNITKVVKAVTKGNLTQKVDVPSKDEIGELAEYYNISVERLKETITSLSKVSLVLSNMAEVLDGATKQMLSGVEQNAIQANSVAAASEEMSATSSEIAQNCILAAKGSETANQAAISGESITKGTIDSMARINEFVKLSTSTAESLGERSDQIGEVINLINEIAEQTNLLALNAAIEAARAGEHGRGFAVVADEVRKLAEKTTGATKQVADTIRAMQLETKEIISSMEKGVKEVEAGVEQARRSGDAIRDILKQIDMVTKEISQIAVAAEEQTATTNEIAGNIQKISHVIEESAKSINKNGEIVSKMADLSAQLKRRVGLFRLATQEEAKEMVERAAEYIKTHGKEKAFMEFNNPEGEFIKGELFIFAQDYNGVMLAYGGNPALTGKCLIDDKDAAGKYLGRGMIEMAKRDGNGWFEYPYLNPYINKVQQKITYIKAMGDYYIACGVYK